MTLFCWIDDDVIDVTLDVAFLFMLCTAGRAAGATEKLSPACTRYMALALKNQFMIF